jgi:hypothetical protein
MGTISITLGNEGVGSIAFTQPKRSLNAIRTAGGFRVLIPATMMLAAPSIDYLNDLVAKLEAVSA